MTGPLLCNNPKALRCAVTTRVIQCRKREAGAETPVPGGNYIGGVKMADQVKVDVWYDYA